MELGEISKSLSLLHDPVSCGDPGLSAHRSGGGKGDPACRSRWTRDRGLATRSASK